MCERVTHRGGTIPLPLLPPEFLVAAMINGLFLPLTTLDSNSCPAATIIIAAKLKLLLFQRCP
ncbi:uncharacterized protein DS421_11g333520 [Arachis hypogaea]|nr:uncharacterized protein DS421_11g333520 [Arachis hypogaea]